jgi:phosphonate transport system substrate-binding protein
MVKQGQAFTAAVALVASLAGCTSSPYREVEVRMAGPPAAVRRDPRPAAGDVLRISVAAMESPRDTYAAYSRLFDRIAIRSGARIEFVQRRTYREINDLLAAGELDAAMVCTGGFVDLRRRAPGAVELIAVPVAQGRSTYESLVIVPAASAAERIEDLAGRRFAFTDELSFSGHAYLVHYLHGRGQVPERFFAGTTFTGSHDRSVSAVANGILDGASVHGHVYERLVARDASLRARTRVIHRSPHFGMMPVVVSKRLPAEMRDRLREALLALADDPLGAEALRAIELERFAPPPPGLYDTAFAVMEPH